MANYIGWVLTNKGRELLSRSINNETRINITKLKIGSGYNNGNDRELLDLVEYKNTYMVSSYERKDSGTVEFIFIVSNRNSSGDSINNEAYRINEMGIFAQDDNGNEIMYAYNKGTEGDYLPVYNGKNSVEIIQKCIVVIDQNAELNVTIDSTMTYVTLDAFNRLNDKLSTKANASEVITNIRLEDRNLKITKNGADTTIRLAEDVPLATDTLAGKITRNTVRELAIDKINEIVTDTRIAEKAMVRMQEFGVGSLGISSGNINDYRANGLYVFSASQGGLDGATNGVINFQYAGRYGVQLSLVQKGTPKAYLRSKNNGTFTEWKELMQRQDFDLFANAYLGNVEPKVINGRNAVSVREGDVLVYDTNNKRYYYKSKINGNITIPTEENTEKLTLGSGSGTGFEELKRKLMIGAVGNAS